MARLLTALTSRQWVEMLTERPVYFSEKPERHGEEIGGRRRGESLDKRRRERSKEIRIYSSRLKGWKAFVNN